MAFFFAQLFQRAFNWLVHSKKHGGDWKIKASAGPCRAIHHHMTAHWSSGMAVKLTLPFNEGSLFGSCLPLFSSHSASSKTQPIPPLSLPSSSLFPRLTGWRWLQCVALNDVSHVHCLRYMAVRCVICSLPLAAAGRGRINWMAALTMCLLQKASIWKRELIGGPQRECQRQDDQLEAYSKIAGHYKKDLLERHSIVTMPGMK